MGRRERGHALQQARPLLDASPPWSRTLRKQMWRAVFCRLIAAWQVDGHAARAPAQARGNSGGIDLAGGAHPDPVPATAH